MPRIRTIKPGFWMDEDLSETSESTMIMAIGLLNMADDEGYFRANPGLIKAAIFPLREPSLNIHGMLSELSNIDYLTVFDGTDGKKYGLINGFCRHQKINRPSSSEISELCNENNIIDSFSEDSLNNHGILTGGKERKGKERKGKERKDTMSSKLDSSAKTILSYLNEKTGRKYKNTATNIRLIAARINEGYSEPEIMTVIDRKTSEWMDDSYWSQFLRPSTLFNAQKFNDYAGQVGTPIPVNGGKSKQQQIDENNHRAAEEFIYSDEPDNSIQGEFEEVHASQH